MPRYANNGKNLSAAVHASRSWTCDCGRTVNGNGGKSSHQRACETYLLARIEGWNRILAERIANDDKKGRDSAELNLRFFMQKLAALNERKKS